MSQLIIVTTPQNSGNGTPLATAFNYTNTNFSELYARYQVSPPTSLIGKTGDVAGMYASDSNYFYYCFANYNGTSTIWALVTQVGNISVSLLQNGTSNVVIGGAGSNVTVGVNGTSNVAVFSTTGLAVKGLVSATGNIRGSYLFGNGSQLTGLPATYTDANVTLLLSSFGPNNISSTGTITAANITGGNLLTGGLVSATGTVTSAANVTGGNLVTAGIVTATGGLTTVANINAANVITTGYVSSANGLEATSTYPGPYADGIVVDYATGMGRISVGTADGLTIYNGGIANTALVTINPSGSLTASANLSAVGNVIGGNIKTIGNVLTQGIVSATGNIVTSGYFVGTFVGNVTGNFVVPGSNTQVIFNTNGVADAVGGLTYNKDSNTLTVLGAVSSYAQSASGNITAANLFTTGNVSASGNVTGGNLVTAGTITTTGASQAGSYSTAGNVTSGNLLTGGQLSAAGNVYGTNLNTGGNVSATGNVSVTGNVRATNYTGSSLSVTGTVVGNSLTSTSFILGGYVSVAGNVTGASLVGAIATASQPAITQVGTLSSLSVSGNIVGANINTTGAVSTTGTISGGNLTITNVNAGGNVSAANFSGQSLSLSGNVNTGGQVSAVGNITGNYLLGNVALASGFPATYGNTQVTTLLAGFGSNSISTTGSVTASSLVGGVLTGSSASVSGNVTGASLVGAIATASQTAITAIGTLSTLSVTGNVTSGNVLTSGAISTSGNVYGANLYGTVTTASQTLITSIGTLGTLSVTGNITGGNLSVGSGTITATNILSGAANGAATIGNTTTWFGNAYVQAVNALYADLAEIYVADGEYEAGTVVVFGGTAEITTTNEFADVAVAGAISTDPAYLMNSSMTGLPVALRGRIPVKVVGPVAKGDLLVTAGANPGYAVSVGKSTEYPLAVFAKAIETNTDEGVKVIQAVIL